MGTTAITTAELNTLKTIGEEVARTAASSRIDLRCAGVARLFDTPVATIAPTGGWVVAPAEQDPLVATGNLPVPRKPRARLRDLVAAGLSMDAIYLAHEVDEMELRRALPALAPGGVSPIGKRELETLVGQAPPTSRSLKTARTLDSAATKVTAGARTLAVGALAVPGKLLDGLDPVILGVCTSGGITKPGTPGVWFELARWKW